MKKNKAEPMIYGAIGAISLGAMVAVGAAIGDPVGGSDGFNTPMQGAAAGFFWGMVWAFAVNWSRGHS